MSIPGALARRHAWAVRSPWLRLLTALTRALLALAFLPSGFAKLGGHPFTVLPVSTPVGLFFAGFFQAQGYYRFVGAAQVLAALLLLVPATAPLGAAIYFPIILNIFVITVAVDFGNTRIIAGLMALATVYLLLWDLEKWKALLPGFDRPAAGAWPGRVSWWTTASLAGAAAVGMLGVLQAHQAWLRHESVGAPLLVTLAGVTLAVSVAVGHLRTTRP